MLTDVLITFSIMAGLNHSFLLLPLNEFAYWSYDQLYNEPQALLLHDDIIRYVVDSLVWIPCHLPVRRNKMYEHKGLNLYGATIIKEEGADAAYRVFSLWAELFSQAPKVMKLKGSFTWSEEDGGAEKGKHETIIAERDKVVGVFRQLAEYAKKV